MKRPRSAFGLLLAGILVLPSLPAMASFDAPSPAQLESASRGELIARKGGGGGRKGGGSRKSGGRSGGGSKNRASKGQSGFKTSGSSLNRGSKKPSGGWSKTAITAAAI